jgi:hypothetical protein
MNAQSFEDCERMSLVLQICFLKSNGSLLTLFSLSLALHFFVLFFFLLILDFLGDFSYILCVFLLCAFNEFPLNI